jgi:4-amino-4-deoxy-L-arabinose transferase-like glycosyltransferase
MPDNSVDTPNLPAGNATRKKTIVYLIAVTLFAVSFNLGGRPIETKDYLRYAEVSREILEFNDWVMLYLNGSIYVDKPPLHFWLTACAYKIFGVNPFAARLPSSLAAIGGVLLTFFFARRLFGSTQIAFMAAIMLLSAYDYMWWARRTRVDMLFAVLFSASLVCFYCGSEAAARNRKAFWYLAFWFITGLAFMDKAFIALANLIVVMPYSIMVTRKSDGRGISPGLLAATSPCLLLPILPWGIALVNHPQFHAFWEILGRTKIMDRQEAFYFYLVQMPLKLLPTTPFFAMGIWIFIRRRRQIPHYYELSFALLWIGFYLFILHLTVAKNTRYLLPIYLPVSLVSAWAVQFLLDRKTQWLESVLKQVDRILVYGVVLSLVAPLAIAYYYGARFGAAILYTAFLGTAFVLTRRFLPYRAAGLFVSVIILLIVIDVGDTVGREKASVYYRIYHLLKQEKLVAEQIALYKCDTRIQEAMSFYFNRIILCSNNWAAINSSPKISAVVTTREAIEKEIPPPNIRETARIISLDKGWVIYIKDLE